MPSETIKPKPVEIFYSYASTEDGTDEKLQQQLEKHLGVLKRLGKISNWHKRNISLGQVASEETNKHLNTAQIILLLISPDFVNSDDCWDIEMSRALERQKEEKTLVIPVLLRPVDYKEAPFYHLRVLPKNGKPVTIWNNQDEAFADIVHNIRLLAEKFERTQKISWSDLGVGVIMAVAVSTLATSSVSGQQQMLFQTKEVAITGTWFGGDSQYFLTLFLTQTGDVITGTGKSRPTGKDHALAKTGHSCTIRGLLLGNSVKLSVFIIETRCYQFYRLILSQDRQSLSGYLIGCNDLKYTTEFTKQ